MFICEPPSGSVEMLVCACVSLCPNASKMYPCNNIMLFEADKVLPPNKKNTVSQAIRQFKELPLHLYFEVYPLL